MKEYLYIGHYIDIFGRYILKIGTTNNLKRRAAEHTRHYRQAKDFQMPENEHFQYDWTLKLSKYNTLRYEDKNREAWKTAGIGEYIRNDRFYCPTPPASVDIKIRKVYNIPLAV